MIIHKHYYKYILSLCKSAVAIATAVLAGCAPKVNYPVGDDVSLEDRDSWPKAPNSSANTADETSSVFIPHLNRFTSRQQAEAYIETYSIRANVVGGFAEIETEVTVRNPDKAPVAGTLEIPMPEGAVVTGYAIDISNDEIKHQMVDAVMVNSSKLNHGRKNDESSFTKPNRFQTEIDAILPHGYRTVRLIYTIPVKLDSKGNASVFLPMQKTDVRKRTISISVNYPGIEQPKLSENIGSAFSKDGSVWVLERTDKNVHTDNDIYLSFPAMSGESFYANKYIERNPEKPTEQFFMFDINVGKKAASLRDLSRIRLIWDASGSRTSDDINKSLEVIRRLPQNSAYELHVFRNRVEPVRSFQNRDELVRYLENVAYDGGTDFQSLQKIAKAGFDGVTLLFTDGENAYQKAIPAFDGLFSAIVSGHADVQNDLGLASSGNTIRLNQFTADEVFAEIQSPRLSVYHVTGSHISDIQWINRGASDRVSVIGKWDGVSDTVTFHLTDGTTYHATLSEADEIHSGRVLATSWAIEKIHSLSYDQELNRYELVRISKEYSVPGPFTAMVVLTTLQDWKNFRLIPPKSLTGIYQAWTEYEEEHAGFPKKRKLDDLKFDGLNSFVLDNWKKYVAWWNHPLPNDIKKTYQCNNDQTKCTVTVSSEFGEHYTKSFQPPKNWSCNEMIQCYRTLDSAEEGSGTCRIANIGNLAYGPRPVEFAGNLIIIDTDRLYSSLYPQTTDSEIEFMEWDRETPYLKSLAELRRNGGDAESLYAEYLKWRGKYASSSAFFFDVADYFFAERLNDYAIRVLSNLFEYGFNNYPSQADGIIIAQAYVQRLMNAGELDEALNVIETLYSPETFLSDNDHTNSSKKTYLWLLQQSDLVSTEMLFKYATILDMRARKNNSSEDAQRALNYYHKLIVDPPESTDFEYQYINNFISLRTWVNHKKFKISIPVIPELEQQMSQPLDADLRVVAESDEDYVDAFYPGYYNFLLYVIEPTTEIVSDRNDELDEVESLSRSALGGLIMHNTYAIKKAEKGEYYISASRKVEHDDILGQEIVTITIYRNWGRPNQSQEIVVKRLENKELSEFEERGTDCNALKEKYIKTNPVVVKVK